MWPRNLGSIYQKVSAKKDSLWSPVYRPKGDWLWAPKAGDDRRLRSQVVEQGTCKEKICPEWKASIDAMDAAFAFGVAEVLSTWISPRMGCKVLEHLFQEGHCAFRRTAVGIGRVDLKSVSGFHCDGRGKEAPIFQKSFLEGAATDPQRLRAADPNALPGWWSRTVHERHGTTVGCLEEGKVIYVCSWYLHGTRARRSQHFSIPCLDQN